MEQDPYVKIKNILRTAKYIGRDVAKSRNIPIGELKQYIRPKEIVSIIKQIALEEDGNYLLNTKLLRKIFTEVNDWILGVHLSKMAAQDLIETYWNDELNCMTFSAKDKKDGKKSI